MPAPFATTAITSHPGVERRALRIAMLAPPWIAVPPAAYGGVESVVALLTGELVARGHDVTLFAAPGSRSSASVCTLLDEAHPDSIGASLYEADHVARAHEAIEEAAREGAPFDVVHDHSGFSAVAAARHMPAPVVHTVHGPFDSTTAPFYIRHGRHVRLVVPSRFQLEQAPAGVRVAEVVANPLRVRDWPFVAKKDDYLLWMGRFDPVKGADRAIAAARLAGERLLLAGPIQRGQEQYFAREIAPQLEEPLVSYLGEVGGALRTQLFAHARALLMPIRWGEPFGMVMVEALACGTPVIAFPEGAAREIVIDGRNGFHVADEDGMARALARLAEIDPLRCRESVSSRYEAKIVAGGYEAAYWRAIRAVAPRSSRTERRRRPAARAGESARESALGALGVRPGTATEAGSAAAAAAGAAGPRAAREPSREA